MPWLAWTPNFKKKGATVNAIEAILFALIVFGVFLGYDLRAIRKSLTDIHQTLREIEKQLRFRNSI